MGMYSSSLELSMTALTIVVILELLMLGYTVMNPGLYGPYIGRYRLFTCPFCSWPSYTSL